MGDIIDLDNVDNIYRCNQVKLAIILITLICTPISLIFLIFACLRMLFKKKKINFLTSTILFVFVSEMVNTISKLLQLTKYFFEDQRDNKELRKMDTERGIICQIQIVTSMFSDFCSLLGTLLLSLRCYGVVKNRKGFFAQDKNKTISIISIILISLVLSIAFLFIDRKISEEYIISYRYDVRDRCSYWCWLWHSTSIMCYVLYGIILVIIIIFALKTRNYLKKEYYKLLPEKDSESNNSLSTPLNENDTSKESGNNFNSKKIEKVNKLNGLTDEEKARIEQLKIMINKFLVYPLVTIIIWSFFTIYRIPDDLLMETFDASKGTSEDETKFFKAHGSLHFFVQAFLIIHTFLSSTRGIFYGLSFIVFEEKTFYNCYERCCCIKKKFNLKSEEENKNIESNRSSNISEQTDNKTCEDNDKQDEIGKRDTIEMNTSEYHYNENN
jgi:hypothetical protein